MQFPLSNMVRACLQTIGSRRALHGDAGESCRSGSNPAGMSLPVSIGPNRCELIYNHDKQPLLELSLRICLPIKERWRARVFCPRAAAPLTGNHHITRGNRACSHSGRSTQSPQLRGMQNEPVSRYRKPPPPQSKPLATASKRPEQEVRFVMPQEGNNSPQRPQSSAAMAKTAAPTVHKDTKEETASEPREAAAEEHRPPPRPRAHPKKCPVQ